jgi:hypothetical protein
MHDAPVQVPSAVLFLIFAVLLLASLLLIRAVESQRPSGARRLRWFARRDESRAT